MKEKMDVKSYYDEMKICLQESVPFGAHEVPKNGTNHDKFKFIMDSFKNPQTECGSACKDFVNCAVAVGREDDAKKEIIRLISIDSDLYCHEDNASAEEEAKEIMEMYTPAQLPESNEVKDKLENVLGKEMINIFERIESAKSDEEALQIIKETNTKDMTINLKDLIMAMYSTDAKDSGDQHQEKNTNAQTQAQESSTSKQAPVTSQVGNPSDMVDAAEYLANTPLGQKLQLFTHIPEVAPAQ